MKVLISGASVAGPALAYWLNRYGMGVTVVERARAVRPGGLVVDFRGADVRVLAQMGILDQLKAHSSGAGATVVVDGHGRRLAEMPAEIAAGDLEVPKGDLTRILYDSTKDDVEYVFGDTTTNLTQAGDAVEVEFEHGGPRTFDLVVGADGLHSRVRTLAFGREKHYTRPLGHSFGVFSTANYLGLDANGVFHQAGDRSITLAVTRDRSELLAFFMFPSQGQMPRDPEAQRRAIRAAFRDVGWELPALMAAMANATDLYFDEFRQVVMPKWSAGRVGLLGDAGYCASPMSGRGTSQALLGAYVLAGELALRADHDAAFAEYESVLRDYVASNQEIGRATLAALTGPLDQDLIDAMAAPSEGGASSDGVTLRDYPAELACR